MGNETSMVHLQTEIYSWASNNVCQLKKKVKVKIYVIASGKENTKRNPLISDAILFDENFISLFWPYAHTFTHTQNVKTSLQMEISQTIHIFFFLSSL